VKVSEEEFVSSDRLYTSRHKIAGEFSGHRYQHSPGAAKVMTEIILDGATKNS
jgi:hypothetical protein